MDITLKILSISIHYKIKQKQGTRAWILHIILDYQKRQSQILQQFAGKRFRRFRRFRMIHFEYMKTGKITNELYKYQYFKSFDLLMFVNYIIFDDNNFLQMHLCVQHN